jgi:hypothetical protein
MQTNAPATSEWVDQFNRAATFGQLDSTLIAFVSSQTPGARVLARWSNVEVANGVALYTSLGTPQDIFGNTFVVPQGRRYVPERLFAIVRSTSGVQTGNTDIRLYVGGTTIGAGNYLDNTLLMSAALRVSASSSPTPVGGYVSTPCTSTNPGTAFLSELTTPQIVTTTGVNASPISNKLDVFASFISLPSAV